VARFLFSLSVFWMVAGSTVDATAVTPTRVYLNGVPTPVYFNDGDSFRVLSGRFKGSRARMSGFNTLESYGPVHQWGKWHPRELSHYATLGTMNARKGVWRCTSDMKRDGYGRVLWDCPDLAVDQVRKGLAHAMTVTKYGAAKALVDAQKEAIKHRRGIWAHGVPEFILTSLHSGDERSSGRAYNRMVASSDGHSQMWRHSVVYAECQTICRPPTDPDFEQIAKLVAEIRAAAKLKGATSTLTDEQLTAVVRQFISQGRLDSTMGEADRQVVEQWLARVSSAGRMSKSKAAGVCMVYVAFRRRYGMTRATCLR
jgi:endonuclease YncB( thermonuclease family)